MDRGRQKAVPAVSVERRIQFNTASDVVAMEEEPKKEEKKEKKEEEKKEEVKEKKEKKEKQE